MAQVVGPRTDPQVSRRMLRAEKSELLRWRRLLRARLDLAVATYAPPEALGTMTWDLLPAAQLRLPSAESLRAAVALEPEPDRVALMHRLRDLDRTLAAYGCALEDALEDCTDQLLAELVEVEARTRRTQDPR